MSNRFNRMTPRMAILAVFMAFGATIGGFAGSIPVILRNAGISSFEFGMATMVSTLATIAAMAAAGTISRRWSNRAVILALLPAIATTGFWMMTSASPVMFFVASIGFGAAMGGMDVFMNAEGSAIEHDVRRPVFTAFHGSLSLTIPVFALLGSYLSASTGPWLISVLSGSMLALAWLLVFRFVPARSSPRTAAGTSGSLPFRLPLVLLGIISGLCVSCEISAIIWSAKLLDEQAPRLAAVAGLGAAFYSLCNATIRFAGDRLRARFRDLPVLITSIIVAGFGFALLGLSSSFTMSVIAFAIAGFGAALLTPCAFSIAASYSPENRAAGLGFVSMISGLPRIAAPWAFGWSASHYGVGPTFGLLTVVLGVALAVTLALRALRVPPPKLQRANF